MPKQIKPTLGIPAKEFLEGFCERGYMHLPEGEGPGDRDDPEFKVASDVEHMIRAALLPHVNSHACLTRDQADYLHDELMENGHSIMIRPEDIDEAFVVAQDTGHRLAILINSYRLDCENCLRPDCKMREHESPNTPATPNTPEIPITDARLISVEDIDFSIRATNFFHNANIQTLGDLCKYSEADLLKTKNFGARLRREVRLVLAGFGLCLAGEHKPTEDEVKKKSVESVYFPSAVLKLKAAGISTLGELTQLNEADLFDRVGLDKRELWSVYAELYDNGLKLKSMTEADAKRRSIESAFNRRISSPLKNDNLHTLGDLCQLKAVDLLAIKGIGKNKLEEIRGVLAGNGLKLIDELTHTIKEDAPLSELFDVHTHVGKRIQEILSAKGVETVRDLCELRAEDIEEINDFNDRYALNSALVCYGLKLKD